MSEESRHKGFINRWSTRKQRAERQEEIAHSVQRLTGSDDVLEPERRAC